MSSDLTRIPPHAIDAEQAALGAMLLSDTSRMAGIAMIGVRPVWYREDHRLIYDALLALHERRAVVNTVTLRDELERVGILAEVGGVDYVIALAEAVPNCEDAKSHIEILLRHWAKRECIAICRTAALNAYESATDPEEVLTTTAAELDNVSASLAETRERPLIEEIAAALAEVENGAGTGYRVAWSSLQNLMPDYGMMNTRLWTIGARTSHGKTEVACQFCMQFVAQGARAHYVTLEEPVSSIYARLACIRGNEVGGVPGYNAVHNQGKNNQAIAEYLSGIRVSRGSTNVGSIIAQMSTTLRREGRNVFVVDYLQCVQPTRSDRNGNRHRELTDIMMRFRDFTVEYDVMMLVLSQLRRGEGSQDDRKPHLSDLKESGTIEEASHGVLLIYCPIAPTPSRPMELIVAKHRNGATGSAHLVCDFAVHQIRDTQQAETDASVRDITEGRKHEADDESTGYVPF